MCDPVTLMIAGAVTNVAGQLYAADAAADAANYSAQVNEQNAILADRRAKDAIERGQLEEERKKREGTALRKQQEASFTAANLDTGYGSPLDVIMSSAAEAELDAAIIRMNAEREAEDYEIQAVNYRNQATLDRSQAKSAKAGGIFAAAGTVIDGGAGIFKYQASIA